MKSMMTMDRSAMAMPGMTAGSMNSAMPMSGNMNMMMVPRCTIKMEKCKDGMKMMCSSTDEMAMGMMQNLCNMMGGMMSCCMMMNGMMMMSCNLTMGLCKCEITKNGICITCTSGDEACCKMIQECCDCMMAMMQAGCTCCFCMNGMPVCCGTC